MGNRLDGYGETEEKLDKCLHDAESLNGVRSSARPVGHCLDQCAIVRDHSAWFLSDGAETVTRPITIGVTLAPGGERKPTGLIPIDGLF